MDEAYAAGYYEGEAASGSGDCLGPRCGAALDLGGFLGADVIEEAPAALQKRGQPLLETRVEEFGIRVGGISFLFFR